MNIGELRGVCVGYEGVLVDGREEVVDVGVVDGG